MSKDSAYLQGIKDAQDNKRPANTASMGNSGSSYNSGYRNGTQ